MQAENEKWYRNQWVWLVIAIPALTVVGCMLTIYLAVTNPDHLVSDQPDRFSQTAEGVGDDP